MINKRLGVGLLAAVVLVGAVAMIAKIGQWKPELEAATPVDKLSSTHTVTVNDKVFVVEVASTPEEQSQGLSNRSDLAAGRGMLFPFNPPQQATFWMKDMKFNLDLVWISNNKIVQIDKNVPAPAPGTPTSDLPTYRPSEPVDYVLELKAGQGGFEVGDQVQIAELQAV